MISIYYRNVIYYRNMIPDSYKCQESLIPRSKILN
jgi:hypothetical protein